MEKIEHIKPIIVSKYASLLDCYGSINWEDTNSVSVTGLTKDPAYVIEYVNFKKLVIDGNKQYTIDYPFITVFNLDMGIILLAYYSEYVDFKNINKKSDNDFFLSEISKLSMDQIQEIIRHSFKYGFVRGRLQGRLEMKHALKEIIF